MLLPKIWIICRVCLKQEEMFNIFHDIFDKDIWSLLRDCGGVPVRKNDNLPDKICEACLSRLWKAINFRFDCQRGHRELVQRFMERNVLMNDIDLEEEYKPYSEFQTISNASNDGRPLSTLVKVEKQISPKQSENDENITTTRISDENESINSNIKQYCVVMKNDKKDTKQETINKSQEKQPIILLLKLKNIPNENTQTRADETEAATKTAPKRKTKKRTVTKRTNRKKTDAILKCKAVKSKLNNCKNSAKGKAKFTCKVCKKTYKSSHLLRHHNYTHKKPHQCKICKKRFSQIQSFLSHNNLHTGIRPYYCRICYKTFSDMTNRNSHERKSHKNQEFTCDECNKKFRFLSLLQTHAQSHRPKKCFICNKDFASLQMVRHHHQRKHLKLENKLEINTFFAQ